MNPAYAMRLFKLHIREPMPKNGQGDPEARPAEGEECKTEDPGDEQDPERPRDPVAPRHIPLRPAHAAGDPRSDALVDEGEEDQVAGR